MQENKIVLYFEGKAINYRNVLYFNDVYECEYLGNPIEKPIVRLLAMEVTELVKPDTVAGFIWFYNICTKKVDLHVFLPQAFNLKYLTTNKPELFDKYFKGDCCGRYYD